MAYIFRQKLNLNELAVLESPSKKILLAEPEEYLLQLYSRYLDLHNFEVHHCQDPLLLQNALPKYNPHLLILNIDASSARATLRSVRSSWPHLPIVTIGYNVEPATLRNLMTMGISSHIDRRMTRPQDLVIIAQTILQ